MPVSKYSRIGLKDVSSTIRNTLIKGNYPTDWLPERLAPTVLGLRRCRFQGTIATSSKERSDGILTVAPRAVGSAVACSGRTFGRH